jgi:hypothetical protein
MRKLITTIALLALVDDRQPPLGIPFRRQDLHQGDTASRGLWD